MDQSSDDVEDESDVNRNSKNQRLRKDKSADLVKDHIYDEYE